MEVEGKEAERDSGHCCVIIQFPSRSVFTNTKTSHRSCSTQAILAATIQSLSKRHFICQKFCVFFSAGGVNIMRICGDEESAASHRMLSCCFLLSYPSFSCKNSKHTETQSLKTRATIILHKITFSIFYAK